MKNFYSLVTGLTFLIALPLLLSLDVNAQNNALDFDGSEDYVSLPTSVSVSQLNNFTIEVWFNSDGTQSSTIYAEGTTSNINPIFSVIPYSAGSGIEVVLRDNSQTGLVSACPNTIWAVNEWNHLAIVRTSATTLKVYLNGILTEDLTFTAPAAWSPDACNIGVRQRTVFGQYMKGKIDEVRIWNDVRTETEIRANMYLELPDPSSETNLISYYKFNESDGTTTAADSKGSNTGTLTNMTGNEWEPSAAFFGPKNNLEFDGTDDKVVTASNSLLTNNSFTIEAWAKRNNGSTIDCIFSQGTFSPNIGLNFGFYTEHFGFGFWGGNYVVTIDYTDTDYHHWAGTYDATTNDRKIYRDGVLVASDVASADFSGSGSFNIGNLWSDNSYTFDGEIDELRVWNDVRTETEIRENMCKTLTGNETGLIAYYTFDNNSGTTLQDFSGNDLDGTLNNMDDSDWVTSTAFNSWLNTSSTDWSETSNWSDGAVPTLTDNVGIADLTGDPTIGATASASCNNLVVNTSATLTIESTASGTGSLIVENNFINNGTLDAQRYIAGHGGSASHGWHFLSSPVEAQAIGDFHTAGSGNDFYKWDETTETWINRTATGGGLNGSFETEFGVGTGYLVANVSTSTKSFGGDLNVDDVSVTGLTNTGAGSYTGWHLMGNPYSSALIWDEAGGWTMTNIDANCQIWHEGNASYTVISQDGIIPAMNGFMVHASASGASMTIPASSRTHNSTAWYKNSKNDINRLLLKAVDGLGQTAQETVIAFDTNATGGYDTDFDSYYLAGYAPIFYSKGQNEYYALNTLPAISDNLSIPLGFEKNSSTDFYIEIEGISSLQPSYPVFLTDNKTGITHDLSENPVYYFTASDNDDPDRFLLTFRNISGVDEVNPCNLTSYCIGNTLYISNPDNLKGTIMIVNMLGQEMMKTQLVGGNKQQVNHSISSGYYIVNISGEGFNSKSKVFIK